MTVLGVVPDDIASYGRLIGRIGDDASEAQAYVYDHGNTDIGGLGGRIFRSFFPAHEAAIEAAHKMLGHLKAIATESDRSLNKNAEYYRHAEHSVAAKVDATYPKVSLTPSQRDVTASRYQQLTGRPLGTHNFADVKDVRAMLKEPETAEIDFKETFEMNPGSVFDYFSPSNAASQVVRLIIGRDPIEWLVEWFAGDWKMCFECGGALENVGAMMRAVSTNIHMGANELRETWMGNASDAAYRYFEDLAVAVGDQQGLLAGLGEQYKQLSNGVLRMQDTAVSLIKGMFDAALVAAAAASSGMATIESGVGGLAGGLIAGAEAARIWEMWERVTMIPDKLMLAGNAFTGFAQTNAKTMANFGRHPLPATGYRSPMA